MTSQMSKLKREMTLELERKLAAFAEQMIQQSKK